MKARIGRNLWLAMAVWGLVLILGSLARAAGDGVGQDVNWADPNEASWFSASWTSASLNATLYNPAENPASEAKGVTRTLNVSARIRALNPEKVLGLSYIATDLRAINEKEIELLTPSQSGLSWRPYSLLAKQLINPNSMFLGLSLPMDPNLGYPLLLKEITWTTYALLYQKKQSVDIPFQVMEQWVQIVPGVRVLIEEASSQDGRFRYQFKAEFEGTINPFMPLMSIRDGEAIPGYLISEIQLLDANDMSVYTPGTSGGFSGGISGSTGTATAQGSGTCSACGGVKTMRFVVAFNPYEVKIPFILTDIPVPTF